MKIELQEQCPACKGTGLYVGYAERNGAAVVCHTCKGTGCHHFVHEYEPFTVRQQANGVRRVYEVNPGIFIGEGNGHKLEDFGGMPVKDWLAGLRFVAGMENRKYTCPAWWYQLADYSKKPKWSECDRALGSSFSRCPHFCDKAECWKRWDAENKESKSNE